MTNFSFSALTATAVKTLFSRRLPGQVIIQITDRCNAHCPHCGMRVSNRFERTSLPMDTICRILDAAGENRAAAVSFTGGEPLLHIDDLAGMILHAGEAGIPLIRTGTNGFFMRPGSAGPDRDMARIATVAEKLAATPLRNFWISVDSCVPEVHDRMRGFPGVTAGIEAALPVFHDHGIFPAVNLGINRNLGGDFTAGLDPLDFLDRRDYLEEFYHRYTIGLERFYRRVIDMGFTMLNTCYPMSVDATADDTLNPVYAATAADRIVSFDRQEKAVLFRVLLETVEKFRSKIRVFSPTVSLHALYRYYSGDAPERFEPAACRGGADFFFIDARSGDTFPCGYRGNESLGKYWEIDMRRIENTTGCRQCDWECFRDPSEQFFPLLYPGRLVRRAFSDNTHLRFWLSDLAYYRACDFFDGRRPPKTEKLASWRGAAAHLSPFGCRSLAFTG
ncbi:MAG: radical SAM protein [Thermodesulfobacteriota bacterium]|nr:radical SAM protein [Thermodesulfobacteriota bacterium]